MLFSSKPEILCWILDNISNENIFAVTVAKPNVTARDARIYRSVSDGRELEIACLIKTIGCIKGNMYRRTKKLQKDEKDENAIIILGTSTSIDKGFTIVPAIRVSLLNAPTMIPMVAVKNRGDETCYDIYYIYWRNHYLKRETDLLTVWNRYLE